MAEIFGSLDPFLESGEIMGRSVANEGFIRALMHADPFEEYHFFVQGDFQARRLSAKFATVFPKQAARDAIRVADRTALPRALAKTDYHCFHLSDCINNPAWLAALRNRAGRETFPITSVTHSLSYARYPQAFLAHLWPGTTSRDCIVGTSCAAMNVVGNIYSMLRQGYGLDAGFFPGPALECIPLGVDTEDLTPPAPEEKAKIRQRLGFGSDEVVLFVFGRLSHHSKMDLLPVFRVVQRVLAQGAEPSKLRLAFGGWCGKKDTMLRVYRDLAENLGVALSLYLSPEESEKHELFSAADIFLSPVDNPQETFGISVVEAGAFGLPVVASDYDGYRDIIRHGETGFLAPVTGADATWDLDVPAPLVFDTQTHLRLAQRTAVDVEALADSVAALVHDPGLRDSLGKAARERIARQFSWSSVIERYLRLWDDLWSRPVKPEAASHWRHPQMMDYGRVFSGHSTKGLDQTDILAVTDAGKAVYRGVDHVLIYEGLGDELSVDAVKRLLFEARKPRTVWELGQALEVALGVGSESALSILLWALKHDLLHIVDKAGG